MKIIKGLATGLAGFFLFIALPFLGLMLTINNTVLNPQFVIKEIEKLDVAEVARAALADQMPEEDEAYLSGINNTLVQIKPWIDRQIEYTVNRSYDYILGKNDNFKLSINTEEIKPVIVENMSRVFLESPPTEYSQLPVAEQNRQLADFQKQIDESIPHILEIKQSDIPTDVWQTIEQTKQIVNYFRTAFIGLIIFCIVLVVCVVLIFREPKVIIRTLGIIFIIDGLLGLISFLALSYYIPQAIPLNDLPSVLQSWTPGFIRDILSPIEIFTAVLLGVGIILLIISFLAGRKGTKAKVIEQP